jgi:hypothetical protein
MAIVAAVMGQLGAIRKPQPGGQGKDKTPPGQKGKPAPAKGKPQPDQPWKNNGDGHGGPQHGWNGNQGNNKEAPKQWGKPSDTKQWGGDNKEAPKQWGKPATEKWQPAKGKGSNAEPWAKEKPEPKGKKPQKDKPAPGGNHEGDHGDEGSEPAHTGCNDVMCSLKVRKTRE